MQPILTNNANYRPGKVGLPKAVTVSLFQDHIQITGKGGKAILNAPLSQLTNVGKGMGFIAFKVDGQYYGLEFISIKAKLFGLLGFLLSPGLRIAKQWKGELESLGVAVGKQHW
ncbi:MAG TPA: hypothetical protein VLF87_02680 [Patescibacteria group bacterium]|nr:hypothetical protein [Patescibacteria group bacterium]